MNKKIITGVVVAIVVIVVGILALTGLVFNNNVVATVNGDEITNEELKERVSQFEQTLVMQGQADSFSESEARESVLDQLISETLLYQESMRLGFSVSEAEIEEEVQAIIDSLGGEEAFESRMKEVGVSKKDLLRDIERDIIISKYVESILEEEEFVVTEQEIVDFYNLLSSQQELPPYEEVESDLEASIISQKQSEIISGVVTTLYEESEVETSL